jgi:hypothetical protein
MLLSDEKKFITKLNGGNGIHFKCVSYARKSWNVWKAHDINGDEIKNSIWFSLFTLLFLESQEVDLCGVKKFQTRCFGLWSSFSLFFVHFNISWFILMSDALAVEFIQLVVCPSYYFFDIFLVHLNVCVDLCQIKKFQARYFNLWSSFSLLFVHFNISWFIFMSDAMVCEFIQLVVCAFSYFLVHFHVWCFGLWSSFNLLFVCQLQLQLNDK